MSRSEVWNVSLFPTVQQVLKHIHENYFRSLDTWISGNVATRGEPLSSLVFYKDYLRRELSNIIADGE
jgi:hypothetical protein